MMAPSPTWATGWPLARTTPDTFIDVAAAHPLEFAPGSSGRYSNVGYEVLGRVVERVTEQPLAVALEQNVFGPARMSGSALFGTPSVNGYFESKKVGDPYLRFVPASGGVISTVRDIDRFYTALWKGDLPDPGVVETMTTATPSPTRSPRRRCAHDRLSTTLRNARSWLRVLAGTLPNFRSRRRGRT